MLLALLALLVLAQPADAQNLLSNPCFDQDLSDWELGMPAGATIEASWDPMDSLGAPDSGSALVENTLMQEAPLGQGLLQCVPIAPDTLYLLEGWVFIPSGQTVGGRTRLRGVWFLDAGCTLVAQPLCDGGTRLCRLWAPWIDVTDEWQQTWIEETSPAIAQAVTVVLDVQNVENGTTFGVLFDDVWLGVPEPGHALLLLTGAGVLIGARRVRGSVVRGGPSTRER